jgi:hypothetical protein
LAKSFREIRILLLCEGGQEHQIVVLFLKSELQLKEVIEEEFPVWGLPFFNV